MLIYNQNEAEIYMQMAVFLLNNCKFTGCGRAFQTLADLIHHIEDCHIDVDPKQLEKQETQQPSSLALSYILKHFTKGVPIRKEGVESLGRKKLKTSIKPLTLVRSSTPTGSDHDDEEMCSEEEDSDQEYTTQEEFTTELILGMMQNLKDGDVEKPFACPVPGCKKRYKNVNGMKYHARHGHRKDTGLFLRVKKAFKCKCGKCYRTAQALRNHMITTHSTNDLLKQQTPRASTPSTGIVTQQVSTSPMITNAIFSVPPSVAQSVQSVLASTELTPSLSLVPVTLTKNKLAEIPAPTTLQLLSCPQTELKAVSQDMAND